MPNAVAYLALLAWPFVAIWLYKMRPITQATLWTILGGYLLLPVGAVIKFEMFPPFDKSSIPSLTALFCTVLILRRFPRVTRGIGLPEVLILGFLIGPFITSTLNTDALVIGARTLPGVGPYDGASAVIAQLIILLPFFLGRELLRDAPDNEEILRVLVLAGLAYSLPMLFEVRMSPQLHTWIYGYFPHSFEQQIRDGGFRPVVFLGHGLLVGFFAMTTFVAAAALLRTRTQLLRLPLAGVVVYLGAVLVLCKALGALVYGTVLAPLVRFARPQSQLRIAVILGAIALLYPLLRTADLVPTQLMVDTAALVSEDRAGSLQARFDQELQLLNRASERILFGWGRYGRNRVYHEESGQDISVTDGRWIITLGQFGLVGFLAEFGLLALPILRAASALKRIESPKEKIYLATLALIVAIGMVDLLPNSSISPWTWLLAGALLGRAEALSTIRHRSSTSLQLNALANHH